MRARRRTQKDGRGLKGALKKETRAQRRARKDSKRGEGSKARSKGSEGSKVRSKRKRGLKGALEGKRGLKGALEKKARAQRRARTQKEARAQRRARKEVVLGNILPWMVEKKWCKNTKRFCFFFYGLILVGGLPRLKFLKGEKLN
jgi:hypothetical protein